MNSARTIEYTKTLRAKITTTKPHFVQKVVAHKVKVDDAYNDRFHSHITIFIPKLRVNYKKPCVMCHVQNGNGSVLIRCDSPEELAGTFEHLAQTLRSDHWLELWQEIEHLSTGLIDNGEIILDDQFIDTQDLGNVNVDHVIAPPKIKNSYQSP
jgi:hypothetical protein